MTNIIPEIMKAATLAFRTMAGYLRMSKEKKSFIIFRVLSPALMEFFSPLFAIIVQANFRKGKLIIVINTLHVRLAV